MNDLLLVTALSSSSLPENVMNVFAKSTRRPLKQLIASTSLRFMSVDATSADIGTELTKRAILDCIVCNRFIASDFKRNCCGLIRLFQLLSSVLCLPVICHHSL